MNHCTFFQGSVAVLFYMAFLNVDEETLTALVIREGQPRIHSCLVAWRWLGMRFKAKSELDTFQFIFLY